MINIKYWSIYNIQLYAVVWFSGSFYFSLIYKIFCWRIIIDDYKVKLKIEKG